MKSYLWCLSALALGSIFPTRPAFSQPAECAMPTDLGIEGTRTGSITTYVGNNRSAPLMGGLPGPSCQPTVGRERAFIYTPQTTSVLRVSTNYPMTDFDTVAWALDTCAIGARELGCNDDALVPPHQLASTFRTTAEQAAGVPIYLVIAGYAASTTTVAQGTFDLRIAELQRASIGNTCDATSDPTNYCEPGSSCIATSTTSATGTCTADGTQGGRCRTMGMACDMGLGCSARMRCVPSIPLGGMCDPMRVASVCDPMLQCQGPAGMATCISQDYDESAIAMPMFIDACTGGTRVALTDRDDGHSMAAIPIGFPFSFYQTAQTQIWPDTNGWIKFDTAPATDLVFSLPNANAGAAIAPFMDDLVLRASPGSDICVQTIGADPNQQFVIEWLDAYRFNHMGVHVTFEAILSQTTNTIDYVYMTLDPATGPDAPFASGANASIGLQSTPTRFILHSGTVSTMTGVRFAPH